jgi:hypothetical protein
MLVDIVRPSWLRHCSRLREAGAVGGQRADDLELLNPSGPGGSSGSNLGGRSTLRCRRQRSNPNLFDFRRLCLPIWF